MDVLLINYLYDPELATEEALLRSYRTLVGWGEGLVEAGAKVTVLQRFRRDRKVFQGGVTYQFVADKLPPRLRRWQLPLRFHHQIRQACLSETARGLPVTLHINGLLYATQSWFLRKTLPPACVTVFQHHSGRPWGGWQGVVQRRALRGVDGYLFAARDLAADYLQRRVIDSWDRIFDVMEGSSRFSYHDRESSRAQTGMQGQPIFLWVGRLNQNKDPLTVLEGFRLILDSSLGARLYMAYTETDLYAAVRRKIATDPGLKDAVTLLGPLPHAELEAVYNSADFFVLGSAYEGSGFAALEALSCGVVPILTEIPAFQVLTDQGRLGALWIPGDPESFVEAAQFAIAKPWPGESAAVRAYFAETFSYPAIGRRALAVYQALYQRRQRQTR